MVIYTAEDTAFHGLFSKKYTLGLAGYIQDGVMSQEGIHKLCGVLLECRTMLEQFDVERYFAFATASLRNIQNTREAVDQVFLVTGFSIDVISGQAEAYLDYYGVMVDAPLENGLLFDIGGGSTELVTIAHDGPGVIESLPIGSLTLAKEYVDKVFPKQSECREDPGTHPERTEKAQAAPSPGTYSAVRRRRHGESLADVGTGTAGAAGHPAAFDGEPAEKAGKGAMEKGRQGTGIAAENLSRPAAHHLSGNAHPGRAGALSQCETIYISKYGVREGYLRRELARKKKTTEPEK